MIPKIFFINIKGTDNYLLIFAALSTCFLEIFTSHIYLSVVPIKTNIEKWLNIYFFSASHLIIRKTVDKCESLKASMKNEQSGSK